MQEYNVENYRFLTRSFNDLGFGDHLNNDLKTKIQLGLPEFSLSIDNIKTNGEYTRYENNFTRGKEQFDDYYFLNSIKATMHKANGETMAAEFTIFKGKGFNVQEMENLLQGRSVYRQFNGEDGERTGKWYRLDTSDINENGLANMKSYPDHVTRLNPEKELDRLNIIWKDKYEKADAIRDLKAGEQITATVKGENRKFEPIKIEVAPQMHSLVVLNSENVVIKYTNSQSQSMKPVEGVVEQGQKNNAGMQAVQQEGAKVTESAKKVMDAVNSNKEGKGAKNRIA